MAFDPLATAADLADRNITVPDGVNAAVILQSATDAVRDAAECPITVATSTVTLVATDYREIDLPGGPVSTVASVALSDVAVTGWRKVGNSLLMPPRWTDCLPVEVTVTYTHGYPIVPTDIIDLVCAMAAMTFDADGSYGSGGRLGSVRLGDFAESYVHPAGTDSPSPMALPDSVRERLRVRFGAGMASVNLRR